MSLQGIALQDVLNSIPFNDKTKSVLDEYIKNYLNENPKLVSNYINSKGLYHIFYRQKDPGESLEKSKINMIVSFVTEPEAIDWILKNGKNISL